MRGRPLLGIAWRVKATVFVLCLAAVGYAPVQCSGEPDHSLRPQETPGEALYGLAEQFKADGNQAAWRQTLEHLIDRYPNSRYATRARQDLEGHGGGAEEQP